MNEVEQWREWFLQQSGDISSAFLAHKKSSSWITSIFLSSHFKPGFNKYSGGMLIDIGINEDGANISAVGATFSKNSAVLYISSSLINFEKSDVDNAGRLAFSGEEKILSESAEGFIAYKYKGGVFHLLDLSASLKFWSQREEAHATVRHWNIDEYKSKDFEALCNTCFGEGSSRHMSIPKADYESGLSGYALYSCNKINGTYGCKACGGMGVKYENWYLNENPALENSPNEFREGRGSVIQINEIEIDFRSKQ
jgi:hypothetical protein